jgi:hypothetical protein
MWGSMKRGLMFSLIFLILTTFAFTVQITIYRWNTDTQKWDVSPSEAASAEAYNSWCESLDTANANLWNKALSVSISVGITHNTGILTAKRETNTLTTKIYGKWMTDDVFDLFKGGENVNVSYFSNSPTGPRLIKTEKNLPVKKIVTFLNASNSAKGENENASTFYLWLNANNELEKRKPEEGDFMVICIVPKI